MINLPESMRKLDTVVAQDMRRAMHGAFKNGVRHGEWLKAADAERAKQGQGVDLATHTQLELRYSLLQESHATALAELERFEGAPVVPAVVSPSPAPMSGAGSGLGEPLAMLIGGVAASARPPLPSERRVSDASFRAGLLVGARRSGEL